MAQYVTFSYSDNLPQRILSQVPERLKISGTRDPEILLILRLLSGNVELSHHYSSKQVKSRVNYFSSDFSGFSNWKREFPNLLSSDVTAEDLAVFIENTKYSNKAFYSGILSEVSHFLLHNKKGSHTSAFIYIYRILEKISYAFPLIYASKSQDFLKSFNQLKDLMIGDKEKKELGFFKVFVKKLYEGDSIADTSIDVFLNTSNAQVQEQMYKTLKEVSGNSILHEDSTEFDKLSIKYCEMGSFLINVRNRFFHNLNGGSSNIESNRIVDADELFSFINPAALYWISMVFLEITTYSLSEFQSHRSNADV
ncbi:hypothetical protein [Colwellia sp. 20A7]|uniref:hypothetical protein n=1 Tax=Colwellia sp. 20A7 TaxID=2689569 RepID=UPI00135993D0|nr:hypothetical protein [Colwellia sp. 20A7]